MNQQWVVLVGTDGTDATDRGADRFHAHGPMSYGDALAFDEQVRNELAELRKLPAFREPYGVITTVIAPVRTAPSPHKALDNWYTLDGTED